MTAFNNCFLFLDNPHGGVEDIAWLKQNCPWIKGIFCNVRNFAPEEWEAIVRPRALANGLFCGPWGRTAKLDAVGNQIEPAVFDSTIVDKIVAVADNWQSPGLINPEKEVDGRQDALDYIVQKVGQRDIALSVQPIPFASLNWSVAAHLPILTQIMPAEQTENYDPIEVRNRWWANGITCVYMTYGVYGGMQPNLFKLQAPYSLFTGDPIMSTQSVQRWTPTSTGWQACKQTTTPTTGGKMLTEQQAPYTGPYGLSTSGFKSKGPTAEALKRAMGHLKRMPWREYDQQYNLALWEAIAQYKIDKNIHIRKDGSYGEAAWIALRKDTYWKNGKKLPAFDSYSQKLLQDEKGLTSTSEKEAFAQKYITEYWTLAIANEPNIHYDQKRPNATYVNPTSTYGSDCSMMVIQASGYAMERSGLKLVDPAKQNWSGFGNTDMYEDDWPKIGAPFRVGDLSHFQNERHVIECIHAGDIATAVWGSHGQEAGPMSYKLTEYSRYPSEYMFSVRPDILA